MPERIGGIERRRMHAERQLVHLCDVSRYAETESPSEGEPDVRTPQPHLSGVPCLAYSVAAREQRIPGGPFVQTRQIKVQMAHDADVLSGDIVTRIVDQFGNDRNRKPLAIDGAIVLDTHTEIEATEVERV